MLPPSPIPDFDKGPLARFFAKGRIGSAWKMESHMRAQRVNESNGLFTTMITTMTAWKYNYCEIRQSERGQCPSLFYEGVDTKTVWCTRQRRVALCLKGPSRIERRFMFRAGSVFVWASCVVFVRE
jgi:hypothetical protein